MIFDYFIFKRLVLQKTTVPVAVIKQIDQGASQRAPSFLFYYYRVINIKTISKSATMGISVSESNAVREMIQEKERKKIEHMEQIKSELASPIPQNASRSPEKENRSAPNFKNPSFLSPTSKAENHPKNGNFQSTQNKQKNQPILQPSINNISASPPPNEYEEKKEVTQFVSKYLNKESTPVKDTQKKLTKPEQSAQKLPLEDQQPRLPKQQWTSQQILVKGTQKSHIQRVSSLSSPDVVGKQRNKKEFDNFDWEIPSDKDILAKARNIEVLPSMTIILANKFNENVRCMEDCTDSDHIPKSRRQVMRDFLSGHGQSGEGGMAVSGCGCAGGSVSTHAFQLK